MNWIPWTDKSNGIPFKHTMPGIGDGEEKVAAELGTVVLGQNSPYDMMPVLNGVATKCDVKKLDKQNDFNTGVEGSNALRLLKMKHVTLLESIQALRESPLLTSQEKMTLNFFADTSPDELAVGTLRNLVETCKMLHGKWKEITGSLPTVAPFQDAQGPVSMPLDLYWIVCQRIGRPFPVEFASFESTLQILQLLDHIYIRNPLTLMEDLQGLVQRIFQGLTLILVDEKKGYMFLSNLNRVKFMRITRGHPRFQIVF